MCMLIIQIEYWQGDLDIYPFKLMLGTTNHYLKALIA